MTILMSQFRQRTALVAQTVTISNSFRAPVKAQLRPLHIVNKPVAPNTNFAIHGKKVLLTHREPRPTVVVIPVSPQSNSNGLSTLTPEQPKEKPRNLVLDDVNRFIDSLLESPSSPSLSRKSSASELTQSNTCNNALDNASEPELSGFYKISWILNNESDDNAAYEKINRILAGFSRFA